MTVTPLHSNRPVWTEASIRAYGVTMPAVDAAQALYGVGLSKAKELVRAGDVDFPVLSKGRRRLTPTTAVLELLGLDREARAPADQSSDSSPESPGQNGYGSRPVPLRPLRNVVGGDGGG